MKEETKGLFLSRIDTTDMPEDQVKAWKEIDEAIEKRFSEMSDANKKFWEGTITPDEMVKSLEATQKALEELQKKNEGVVEQKEFERIVKEINDNLVRFKAATNVAPSGRRELKTVEEQVREQLKDFITTDEKTGVDKVDLKEACKRSPGNKLPLNLILTKAFLTTNTPLLGGLTVDAELGPRPVIESNLRKYGNVASTATRAIAVADMSATGDAEWVPEGDLKPEMTGTITERTISAGKIALFAKTSEEVLKDIPQLVAEIRLEIQNRINLAEEEGILYGSGQNGEILGVAADIPEFALTGIEVRTPHNWDVLTSVYTQITSVRGMNFQPNMVQVHPVDFANMMLEKDLNGQYLRPLRDGSEMLPGLEIVPTTAQDAGSFLMGDFKYLNIRDYVGFSITFGWENDDFTRNMVTMVGEKRLLAYIKKQHLLAFVKGDFATVKAAIEAV